MTVPLTSTDYPARLVSRLGVTADVRGVRVVHQLDGIEAEVHPADLLTVGHQLWAAWRHHRGFRAHDLILGLDAGGILPTVAVALASSTPYKLAWKLDLDLPDKRVFHERHARRTEVFTYGPVHGRRILIADDEVTSGLTVAGLVDVLHAAGAEVIGVVCLVEETSGGGGSLLKGMGIACCALTTI
jgi:adenine phosphoribosyltransferase